MNEGKTTTIQVNERTLYLLKRLKEEMNANSYDEVIMKKVNKPMKSMAGVLGKYLNKRQKGEILEGLRDKDDRI